MVGNDEDARDVIQEAFLNAFRSLRNFHGDARLSTWLHRIVVNTALMKLRTRKRKPEESIEPLLPAFLADGHYAEKFSSWGEQADVVVSRAETQDWSGATSTSCRRVLYRFGPPRHRRTGH